MHEKYAQQTIQRGEDGEEEDFSGEEDEGQYADVDVAKKGMLPSTNDPSLWQVLVKRGYEKQACMALLNKSIEFARRGTPLSILSVTSSEQTEGYIFVEAFREVHVRQACENLFFCLHKMVMLPKEQMPDVYQNEKAKNNELFVHQWVRVK